MNNLLTEFEVDFDIYSECKTEKPLQEKQNFEKNKKLEEAYRKYQKQLEIIPAVSIK